MNKQITWVYDAHVVDELPDLYLHPNPNPNLTSMEMLTLRVHKILPNLSMSFFW